MRCFLVSKKRWRPEGLLVDLSEELINSDFWEAPGFRMDGNLGSLIRVTAPAQIFDSRYVARILSGMSSTIIGLATLTGAKASNQQNKPIRRNESTADTTRLEDAILPFQANPATGNLKSETLRAVVQLSRGMFTPGLHLTSTPAGESGPTISVRLQEGQQYLETDPEILFARYGLLPQDWTIVGTIGAFADKTDNQQLIFPSFTDEQATRMDRRGVAKAINILMAHAGNAGLADVPHYPGFTIVPYAVYRPITSTNESIAPFQV